MGGLGKREQDRLTALAVINTPNPIRTPTSKCNFSVCPKPLSACMLHGDKSATGRRNKFHMENFRLR